MQVSKETITPKKAMEWLKRNVHNRPIRKGYAERIAKDIADGRFTLNGETIKFNGNGDLIDGQHRLNAIIIAGKPVESYVIRGVPHEAFDTIDTGTPREIKDVFARLGKANYSHLSTAIRIVWALKNGQRSDGLSTAIRNTQAVELLTEYPGLESSVSFVQALEIRKLRSIGQAGALHCLMAIKDEAKANQFWTDVCTGIGLTKGMPAYLLREKLINNRASTAKLRRFDIMHLCVKAWVHFTSGKLMKVLLVRENEEFPEI
jgi:hypothetical protein